jgi:hypothetical protein
MGDEGKAVGLLHWPTALLFDAALVGLWILTWIKERECDPAVGLCTAPFSQKGRSCVPSERDRLRPPEVWWPFSFQKRASAASEAP